jgi:hypothetical protein
MLHGTNWKNFHTFMENFMMRRIAMLVLILLPFAGLTQGFNGGILAGGLVSQVDGDTWQGYHKVGYFAGGFVSLKVSPRSSFMLEMEYIQKGMRQNADSANTGHTYLTRLHYLEIPLLYQYTFAKRFQAEIGPAADVLLGYYEEIDGLDASSEITVDYRAINLCGIIGVSCFLTDHLKAGFRFNYSLMSTRTDVTEGSRKILFEVGQYNNVLSLGLSWYFKPRDY